MKRRNFLVNILLWILAFFFGYTIKKEGENLNLFKTDARMVLDGEGKKITDKIGNLNEQLAETTAQIDKIKNTQGIIIEADFPRLDVEMDDTGRINRAYEAADGKPVIWGNVLYEVSSPIVMNPRSHTVFAEGTIIKAIQPMGSVLTSSFDEAFKNGFIIGGCTIDCNKLAKNGMFIPYFKNLTVEKTLVKNQLVDGYVFGDSLSASPSYELYALSIKQITSSGTAKSSGAGLVVRATDSIIINPLMIGNTKGIINYGSNNNFESGHVWNHPSNGGMTTGFENSGLGVAYVSCYADTPSQYGFHNKRYNAVYISCRTYVNNSSLGKDNTVTGFYIGPEGDHSTFIGCINIGADSAHRVKKNFDGALTNCTVIGQVNTNVATIAPDHLINNLNGLTHTGVLTLRNLSGDGAVLADLEIERKWQLVQKGAGTSAGLFFKSSTANNSFGVLANDGSYALEIEAADNVTNPSRGKIDGKYVVNVRNGSGNPSGVVVPDFVGQDYVDTTNKIAYKACGTGNKDWKQTTN
ncbi:hypothetical protein ACFQ9Y_05020 [Peribacillus simplex]|uniref:hypothetical protein n=1 Tax=Peribacillus simplex TaxID=1478 RepID=UPI00366E2AD1